MREDFIEIYDAFNGKLVGAKQMKVHVCKVLAKMPQEVIGRITRTTWFMSSLDDAWAFTFTGNDLKDKHLIFLSDHLLMQDIDQIEFSIAHEIGHVMLNHRNSVLEKQSPAEIKKQEKEADEFANLYIRE